jgi:1-hydroxycarotenoid 3,4-desaturase
MLVAQVELDGVWSVKGGMLAVAQALADVGERHGVQARYGQTCSRILLDKGRTSGVQLATGEVIPADDVVFNGDVGALGQGLLGPAVQPSFEPVRAKKRSLSAFTMAMHTKASGFPLVRHNVFFDHDYHSEFNDIFHRRRLPRQGTVYVCAQDRNDHAMACDGPERLLCLVNAPADGDTHSFDPGEIEACESNSLALMRQCGLELEWQPHQRVRTLPQDFAKLFPGSGGALYGTATHGWMSAFARHSARSPVPGLYLAGGSVHPGPGVPMAAMSGRLAAATLMADLDSTSRSRRVLISGGMSTH